MLQSLRSQSQTWPSSWKTASDLLYLLSQLSLPCSSSCADRWDPTGPHWSFNEASLLLLLMLLVYHQIKRNYQIDTAVSSHLKLICVWHLITSAKVKSQRNMNYPKGSRQRPVILLISAFHSFSANSNQRMMMELWIIWGHVQHVHPLVGLSFMGVLHFSFGDELIQ